MKKDDPKKKKKFPFYGRASGGSARSRPDRAAYRKGGSVAAKADLDPIEPNEPNAPAGGKVEQKFKKGGGVKRADGGEIDVPNKPPVMPDKPFEHTGKDTTPPPPRKKSEGWGLEEDVPEFLKIEGRDYGKQPAGLGEKILSTGKLLAQPAGAVINRARKDMGFKDGGKLSAAQRQALPKSDFALPGKGAGPKGAGSGSYPIPDRSHAENALARSSGKAEAATVRAKVKAKYPDMGS